MIAPVPHKTDNLTQVRWIILALICLASFVSYVLRTNLSIVGDRMKDDLGLTEIELGLVFSAFAWGYAIFQLPGGVFGDKVGSRKAIGASALLWGVLTLLTGLVPSPVSASTSMILGSLIVLRFLVGTTHAPLFPVVAGQTIANWFPVSGWGFPNGLTSTGLTLGAAAAGPLLVWLMTTAGWRQSFFVTAPLAFLTAGIWWWYVRDFPIEHASVGKAELELIDQNRSPLKPGAPPGIWKKAITNREILLITLSYFCMNYVFYLFFSWFFYYLVDVRSFPEKQAGYFTSAQWIIGALGATLGGYLCDRSAAKFGARWGYRLIPIVSLILAGVFLVAGAAAQNPLPAVVLLALSFGCTQLSEGSFWAAMIAVSGRHAAPTCGVLNTGGNVVGGIGAVLVPVLAEKFGWTWAVSSGAVFAFIGAMLWLFVRVDHPMAQEE